VPVLTPLELAMALGDAEWGVTQYSLDIQDFLPTVAAVPATIMRDKNLEVDDEDADAPYFSLSRAATSRLQPRQKEST
jgi:hypothetical protein